MGSNSINIGFFQLELIQDILFMPLMTLIFTWQLQKALLNIEFGV